MAFLVDVERGVLLLQEVFYNYIELSTVTM